MDDRFDAVERFAQCRFVAKVAFNVPAVDIGDRVARVAAGEVLLDPQRFPSSSKDTPFRASAGDIVMLLSYCAIASPRSSPHWATAP